MAQRTISLGEEFKQFTDEKHSEFKIRDFRDWETKSEVTWLHLEY